MRTEKRRYTILLIGAAMGLVAAFLQTIEKMRLLENKNVVLPCNIDSVFNCSAVLSAPQSSLFGFPNSLICIAIFTLLLGVGIIGMTRSRLSRRTLYAFQSLAFFMLLFALWFLFTSTYVIGAICIFCLVCFLGLLLINGSLWRLNFSDGAATRKFPRLLERAVALHIDLVLWVSLEVIVAFIILQRFYLS